MTWDEIRGFTGRMIKLANSCYIYEIWNIYTGRRIDRRFYSEAAAKAFIKETHLNKHIFEIRITGERRQTGDSKRIPRTIN